MGSCGTKLQKEHCCNTIVSDALGINKHSKYNEKTTESVEDKPLINLRFNRTLFCEDIIYEYEMSCNFENALKWILRLTVENLTKFHTEILQKYPGNKIRLPNQFGKVMSPTVFTSVLNNILQQTSILKDGNIFFTENTANFFCVPSDIRSVLQLTTEENVPDNANQRARDIEFVSLDDECVTDNNTIIYLEHCDIKFSNEKSEIIRSNNYDLSQSTSTNIVVDISQNESFPELYGTSD